MIEIRKYKTGEELELHDVFFSSIHCNAKEYYSQIQLYAWAPVDYDKNKWISKIKEINPFVLKEKEIIIGYADLQENGYIDHFFVRGNYNGKGYGQLLLKKIITEAEKKNIKELTSNISLAAEKLFLKNNFEIVKRKAAFVNGVELDNSLMSRKLV